MKRRIQWIPVLVLLLLPLVAACGLNRFGADAWSGVTIEGDVLYVASGEGRVTALDISGDAEDGRGNPARIWGPYPSNNEDELGPVYGAPVLGAFAGDGLTGKTSVFVATYQDPEDDDDIEANLFAIDSTTGTRNWAAPVPGQVVGSRVKRRLREIARQAGVAPGYDVVVSARPSAAEVPFQGLKADFLALLERAKMRV